MATTTASSLPWSDLNFPKVCSKTLPVSSTLRGFLSAIRSYMLHIPNSLKGNCLTEKENARTMHEKRHKINKFANYQNIIVRNSPAFDCHVFVPSQNRWSLIFDVMRMISTQVHWQDQSTGKTLAYCFASCENIVWISFKRMFEE